MLKEIRCDKFIHNDGTPRGPIKFETGLNTVLGTDFADNSIGKSTVLMIIDFVFGGSDYLTKSDDVQSNVKRHVIQFMFEFDGVSYYFSRDTEDKNNVAQCDENYKVIETIKLEDYNKWLQEQYGTTLEGLSFRDTVSCYWRVWKRENDNPNLPLRSFSNDTQSNGITRLLKLYGLYASIADLQKQSEESKEKLDIYKKAQSLQILRIGKITQKQYDKCQSELEEKKKELQRLTESQGKSLWVSLGLDSSMTQQAIEITSRLSDLQSERRKLNARLKNIETNISLSEFRLAENFDELAEFFPEADMRKIHEIENFHFQLKGVLDTNFQSAREAVLRSLAQIETEIKVANDDLDEANIPRRAKKAYWDKRREIENEISRLTAQVLSFETLRDLDEDSKKKAAEYKTEHAKQLKTLQTTADVKLDDLNAFVYGEERIPPKLEIVTPSRYSFATPNDGGTGTQYRGLLLFDISILDSTPLPALIHDSFLFKNIEDVAVEKILELYQKVGTERNKQIFIAFDKSIHYTQRTKDIIAETTRVRLEVGDELFGRSWKNKTDEQIAQNDDQPGSDDEIDKSE